jgi:perosamine synthetase
MVSLRRSAAKHNLHLIEDAAHALPTWCDGEKVGSSSELAAFSFYATKTITTAEGGMLVTNNAEYARRASLMRLHGISGDAWKRYSSEGEWFYEVVEPGYKLNMPDLLAALGVAQLRKADAFHERRREIAARYIEEFAAIDELELPARSASHEHAWHLFILRLRPEALQIERSDFVRMLKASGIGASVHFIPLHLHPLYRERFGCRPGDFAHAEDAYSRAFSLPIFPDMRDDEVERVIATVRQIVATYRQSRLVIAA